jgi:hypothetical protein
VRLFLPLLGLSMVVGSLVLGEGQNARSEVVGVVPVLSWLVALSNLCCRVATVAALDIQSPATRMLARDGSPTS